MSKQDTIDQMRVALDAYESQIASLAIAESHPVWSDTGYPVLIGDWGQFDGENHQIIEIQGKRGRVRLDNKQFVRYEACKVFGSRSRLPKATQPRRK